MYTIILIMNVKFDKILFFLKDDSLEIAKKRLYN